MDYDNRNYFLGAAPPPAKEDPENDPVETLPPANDIPLDTPVETMPTYGPRSGAQPGTKEYAAWRAAEDQKLKQLINPWTAKPLVSSTSAIWKPIENYPGNQLPKTGEEEDQTVTDENRTALYITAAALLLLLMLGKKGKRK